MLRGIIKGGGVVDTRHHELDLSEFKLQEQKIKILTMERLQNYIGTNLSSLTIILNEIHTYMYIMLNQRI